LKRVETDSSTAETLTIPSTACGRRLKEYFDGSKTIAEVIPHIVGSSTKLKLSEMVISLQKNGQEYDNVSRCILAAGNDVANEGIIMSVSMALFIEKMVNIRESFARHTKRKFPYEGELDVRKKVIECRQSIELLLINITTVFRVLLIEHKLRN
jgi:hypothetical protein